MRCAVGYCNGGIWGWHKRQYCSPILAIDGRFLQKSLKPIPSPCFLSSNENWSFLTFLVYSANGAPGDTVTPQWPRVIELVELYKSLLFANAPNLKGKKLCPKFAKKKFFAKLWKKSYRTHSTVTPNFFRCAKRISSRASKQKKV